MSKMLCVSKDMSSIMYMVYDSYKDSPLYESMCELNFENLISGDIIVFESEKEIKDFENNLKNENNQLIDYKEVLNYLVYNL